MSRSAKVLLASAAACLASVLMPATAHAAGPRVATATTVFGQSGDFTTAGCSGPDANSVCGPGGVAVDAAGNVYVSEYGVSRVVEYDTPFAPGGDTAADRVFGQSDFNGSTCNQGGSASADTLCSPWGVYVDAGGHLFVADYGNSRVLEYDTPLAVGGTTADRVFGQNDFSGASCNGIGLNSASLCQPESVAEDAAGDVYIADTNNNRVLEYVDPLGVGDTWADVVFGQDGSFTSAIPNCCSNGADSLWQPIGVAVDGAGNVFVTDYENSRVLAYKPPLSPGSDTRADRVIGQADFTGTACDRGGSASVDTICYPQGVTVDPRGGLYVTDFGNNRVLWYRNPMRATRASKVFGQPSYTSDVANAPVGTVSASGLWGPVAVAIGSKLVVADYYNSRVLAY